MYNDFCTKEAAQTLISKLYQETQGRLFTLNDLPYLDQAQRRSMAKAMEWIRGNSDLPFIMQRGRKGRNGVEWKITPIETYTQDDRIYCGKDDNMNEVIYLETKGSPFSVRKLESLKRYGTLRSVGKSLLYLSKNATAKWTVKKIGRNRDGVVWTINPT